MKRLFVMTGALLASMLVASAAFAQCQVGVQVGGSIANTEVGAGPFSFDGVGSHSSRPDAGVRGGCDWKLAGTGGLVIGAWADYNWAEIKSAINPGIFSASLGNSYSFGGRAGIMLGSAMPYALLAWTHTDAHWNGISGLPSSFEGLTYGGGIEAPIPGTEWSVAGEVRLTKYNAQDVGGISIQPDNLQALVRLNWNFGGPALPASKPLK